MSDLGELNLFGNSAENSSCATSFQLLSRAALWILRAHQSGTAARIRLAPRGRPDQNVTLQATSNGDGWR